MGGRRTGVADFVRRLVKTKPLGAASAAVIVILIVVAIFSDLIAPYPHTELHIIDRLQGASAKYLLGTDQVGRDLLSRLLNGARISLLVGFAATTLNIVVAMVVGGTSGFVGGKFDLTVQRFVDAWMAFPSLLLLLTIMSLLGPGVLQIILVLGVSGGIGGSRVPRGAVVAIKENDYFQAAQAIGTPVWKTLLRHVLPNITGANAHRLLGKHRRQHPGGRVVGFPWLRPATQHPGLGQHAEPGGAAVHGVGAVAGAVAGAVPDHRRLLPQHVRRRAARPARPPAPRRRPLALDRFRVASRRRACEQIYSRFTAEIRRGKVRRE